MGAPREFIQLTQESAYRTVATPVRYPTASFNQMSLRMDESNSFDMRATPVMTEVPYGGGWAGPAFAVSDTIKLEGTLKVKLCYSQAKFLLDWGFTRINSAQTLPWPTTEPIGDSPSVTIDHAIYQDDSGTWKRTRYRGVKVTSPKLDISRQSPIATLTYGLTGSDFQGNPFDSSSDPSTSVFPDPVAGDFVTDAVLFLHAAGGFTLGSSRTLFDSLSLSAQNVIDARPFENRFVQKCRLLGRTITLDSDLMLKSTPNDRLSFQQLSTMAMGLTLTNGVNSIAFDMGNQARIASLSDDLGLDKQYMRKLQAKVYWDNAAGKDISFAYS